MRHTGAHPRSRGEHPLPIRYYPPYQGSSPLARGTPGKISGIIASIGLIPARAGNTRVVRLRPALSGAHPRSRGEHPCASSARSWCRGSSPLARGTRRGCRQHLTRSGLIPARAGNTMFPAWINLTAGAHPRSRGEHVWVVRFPVVPLGSSPLARGTQHAQKGTNPKTGLIPARAGNTRLPRSLTRCEWAHPRSRGEHEVSLSLMASRMGSSPLARGTRVLAAVLLVAAVAHPRSRGEHLNMVLIKLPMPWLIPARAGNTRR